MNISLQTIYTIVVPHVVPHRRLRLAVIQSSSEVGVFGEDFHGVSSRTHTETRITE